MAAGGSRILRRSRTLVVTPRYWRQRLVFWLGALAIGIVSAGFARLADEAQHLFSAIAGRQDGLRFLPLLVTPLGFGLCAFVAARFVQGSQGSGIPRRSQPATCARMPSAPVFSRCGSPSERSP